MDEEEIFNLERHDGSLELNAIDLVSDPGFTTTGILQGIEFGRDLNVNSTIHIAGETIRIDGEVEMEGGNVTINGNMKINGNLTLNGNLQADSVSINTNKSSSIMFLDLVIKNGNIYLKNKLLTNPSEIGLYLMRRANDIRDDQLKTIEDML